MTIECRPIVPSPGAESRILRPQSRNPEPLPNGRNQAMRENQIRASIQEPAKLSPHSSPKKPPKTEKIARW